MKKFLITITAHIIFFSPFVNDIALGEESAIGLFYPDLGALRMIMGPNDTCNVSEQNTKSKIEECWKKLSKKGREFLLKENDIAIVIVQLDGNWFYRTSGVHTLKPLYASNQGKISSDMNNLLTIIRTQAYQELKDLHYNSLFYTRTANYSNILGAHIERIENIKSESLKDWLLSVISNQMYHMEPSLLATLGENKKYKPKFDELIASVRKNIYKNAFLAFKKSKIPDETPVDITVGMNAKEYAGLLELQPDREWDYWRIQGKWVAGKPAIGGNIYVTADDQAILSKAIDTQNFAKKGVKVFFGAPGRNEIDFVEYFPKTYQPQ